MILSDRGPGDARALSDLEPADRALWSALGGGEPVFARAGPLPADPFWRRLYRIGHAAGSQLDALSREAARGPLPAGPLACVAGTGAGFHGLRGRRWEARSGNLHLAVAIPLADFPASGAVALTLLPAVATAEAIRAATGGRCRPGLKWVNDLLVDGRKVGGVLTGTRVTGDRVETAFLGIGVNLRTAPEVVPTPFVPATGRIPDLGLEELLAATLEAIARRTEELLRAGPGPLLAAYRSISVIRGKAVRVYPEGIDDTAPPGDWPAPLAAGVVREIRDDLTLVLSGQDAPVDRGRLAFESACAKRGLPPI